MRDQLRRTLQQNAAVVQGASCLLLAIDREGIITYLQGAQKASLIADVGLKGEIEGRHISDIKPTEEFMEVYRRVLDGETVRFPLSPTRFYGSELILILYRLIEPSHG